MKYVASLLVLGVAVLSREARAQTTLEASLFGSNVVPGPGRTEGPAAATLTVDGRQIALALTFEIPPFEAIAPMSGLMMPTIRPNIEPIAVHIHEGAAGVTGPVVIEFPWTTQERGPTVTMTGTAPAGFGASVSASPQAYYLEIHTAGFPAGALRGQLRQAAPHRPAPPTPTPPGMGIVPLPGHRVGIPARAGGERPAGVGGPRMRGRLDASVWPPPPPRPLSKTTWEFFFQHFTPSAGRSAGLLETEVPVLTQIADECATALESLTEAELRDERPRILDSHVARLRSRLGEAAFTSLEAYLSKAFEEDSDGRLGAASVSGAPRERQTLSFPPIPAKAFRDPDFRPRASASSGLRVYFTSSGDCSVRSSNVHLDSAGSCWVTAHQPGNERFGPAPEVVQRLMIAKAAQRILAPVISSATFRQPDLSWSPTASSGLYVTVLATGRCTAYRGTVHLLGAGTCSLTAHQPGSSAYDAAPIAGVEFLIAKADQVISIPPFEYPPYGPADLELRPTATSGLPVGVTTEGACTFTGSSLRILTSGACKLKADQPGNEDFNAAPTEARVFEVLAE